MPRYLNLLNPIYLLPGRYVVWQFLGRNFTIESFLLDKAKGGSYKWLVLDFCPSRQSDSAQRQQSVLSRSNQLYLISVSIEWHLISVDMSNISYHFTENYSSSFGFRLLIRMGVKCALGIRHHRVTMTCDVWKEFVVLTPVISIEKTTQPE